MRPGLYDIPGVTPELPPSAWNIKLKLPYQILYICIPYSILHSSSESWKFDFDSFWSRFLFTKNVFSSKFLYQNFEIFSTHPRNCYSFYIFLQMIGKSLAAVTFDWRRLELVLQFSARFVPKNLDKFVKKSI